MIFQPSIHLSMKVEVCHILNLFWDFKHEYPDFDIDIEVELKYIRSGNYGYFVGCGWVVV